MSSGNDDNPCLINATLKHLGQAWHTISTPQVCVSTRVPIVMPIGMIMMMVMMVTDGDESDSNKSKKDDLMTSAFAFVRSSHSP